MEHCWVAHKKKDEPIEGEERVKCMVCTASIHKSRISEHRIIHNPSKLYECKLCYKKFKQNSTLWTHINRIHKTDEEQQFLKYGNAKELKFCCQHCNSNFFSQSILTSHIKAEHATELSINCEPSK